MKVLLINPRNRTKYPQPPLGLAMLAAVLEKKGHAVKIVDLTALGLFEYEIPQIIKQEKPKIVGITAMTSTLNSAVRIAHKVKESDDRLLVVLGGAHASICSEVTLKENPEIDIIVRGEGERTMLDLVEKIEKNEGNFDNVLGLAYRTDSGVKTNLTRPPILNLDSLPFPAFHLMAVEKYRLHPPFGRKTPSMPIIISRGCPYRCIFCSKSVFGNKYRNNSANYVVKQIQFLIENFGVKEIKFYDDVFTLKRKLIIGICSELKKQHIDIPWTCETRVNLVDYKLLRIMKDSGCYMISYGVESGDQGILDSLKKDITLDQIDTAFKLTHRAQIDTVGYFMLGSPSETPETINRTIEFAKRLNPDFVQFSIATPYPGTEFGNYSFEKTCANRDWNKYVYADLKCVQRPVFENKNMSEEELCAWVKRAYASFYLRGNYVLKRLRKLRSLNDLKTDATGLQIILGLN